MKSILYVTDTGSILGGGEISLLNLLENLDRSRFSAGVALPGEGSLSLRLKEMGIPVYLYPYKKVFSLCTLKDTKTAIDRIVRIIRHQHSDLVHTNSTGGIVFLTGMAARQTGVRFISHIRQIQSGFLSDLLQGVLSTRIVMISRMIGQRSSFLPFQKKLILIYNGVNLERFSSLPVDRNFRKEAGARENELLVGAIGTFVRGKGFEYLIKAAALVRKQLPDVKFAIIGLESTGKGSYREYLQFLARTFKVEDVVSFFGRREDIPAVLSCLDLLVFPSLIDPFGRVLIEAMAAAKPVVAFRTGGASEIVKEGETGLLVAPRSHRELAEKIITVLQDKELAGRLGSNGRQRCGQLFDIKTHADKVQRLYLEVLQDNSLGFVVCAVCGSTRFTVVNTCLVAETDAPIPDKTLDLCRCRECGLVYVNPQPRINADFYSEDYFNTGYMKFYSRDSKDAVQSNEPFRWRQEFIARHAKTGALLDIGCATGEFLALMRDSGWNATGIDISAYAVQAARTQYNLDVRKGTLEDVHFADASFDAVSAGDILEHVPDPVKFLAEAARILHDDGVLYLAVPNFASVHYGLMSFIARFNHKNYFVLPHHLYHFSPMTLTMLLEKAGFTVKELVLTESRIQEKGVRRFVMEAIFLLGRILRAKDRIVLIARKRKQ